MVPLDNFPRRSELRCKSTALLLDFANLMDRRHTKSLPPITRRQMMTLLGIRSEASIVRVIRDYSEFAPQCRWLPLGQSQESPRSPAKYGITTSDIITASTSQLHKAVSAMGMQRIARAQDANNDRTISGYQSHLQSTQIPLAITQASSEPVAA